ncbi:MAG: hypothetical protein Kow0022_05880 [Phycisphaerales bacterium]
MAIQSTLLAVVLGIVAAVMASVFGAIVLVRVLKLIGLLTSHVAQFIGGMLSDALRFVGAIVLMLVLAPLVLGSVVIGRWSAAAHFGRAVKNEIKTACLSIYRVVIGHPFRLIGLRSVTEGLENRLPQVIAEAPGPDKPSRRRVGMFDGYTIVGSLPGGGSGGRLYIAEPSELKRAAFVRQGLDDVEQVVIKSFSLADGSSLPQIVRESRALDAAKKLGLVLEHELTEERFFYVMRYVPGESLSTLTTRMHGLSGGNGLDDAHLRQALGYIADLLRALDTYHHGGLWHKDVKPDNIIVDGREAHLVDFGLVTPLRSAMTLTAHGTEYFRDPELVRQALRGVKVHQIDGTKFDIYAAGAVLYSVIENSFPAHGGLSQITKRCPEAVRWIVRRAMTDYDKRYATAAEMLGDLEAVLRAPNMFDVRPIDLPSMAQDAASRASEPEQGVACAPYGPWRNVRLAPWRSASRSNEVHRNSHADWMAFTRRARAEADAICDGCWLAQISEDDALEWLKQAWIGEAASSSMHENRLLGIVRRCAHEEAGARAAGQLPDPTSPVGYAAAGSPVPPPLHADDPTSRAPARPVPKRLAGRPKLRVTGWWSGRYTVEGEQAPRGGTSAPTPHPDLRGSDERPPFYAGVAPKARPARPAPRLSASEQLRAARGRAAAKRRAAQQRIAQSRKRARGHVDPTAINAGTVAGAVMGLLMLAAVGGLLLLSWTNTSRRETSVVASVAPPPAPPAPAAPAEASPSSSPAGPIVLTDAGKIDLASLAPIESRSLVVVSDLAPPLDASVERELRTLFSSLLRAGGTLLGDSSVFLGDGAGPDERQVEIVAELKAARGQRPIDSPDVQSDVMKWLRTHGDVDAVLWIAPVLKPGSGIQYSVFTSSATISGRVDKLLQPVLADALVRACMSVN